MEAFDIELIRFVYLAAAAAVGLVVLVSIEWTLRRRMGEDTPAPVLWGVRIAVVATLLIVAAPILGVVKLSRSLEIVNSGLNSTLLQLGNQAITLSGILTFFFFFALTLTASRLLRRALTRSESIQRVTDAGTVGVIERLVHYGIVAVGITFSLSAAGVNLSGLVTAGAAFAVGIGFALQGVAKNFVSGLILLIERAVKPDDILDLNGHRVRVKRMGIRSTIVRSRDGEDMIVPNDTLAQSTVVNHTMRDRRRRVRATVGVAYESDMEQVMQVLHDTAMAFERRIKSPTPEVLLTGFGSSSVDFEVWVWTRDSWNDRIILSDLNMAIWHALKQAQITIAFPQLDVHLDASS